VKGPDGKSFKGAFVRLRIWSLGITVNVPVRQKMSLPRGKLAEGQYQLMVRAVGYRFTPHRDHLTRIKTLLEIALDKGTVH